MSWLDIIRGRAITIPPLDGAFRPNSDLDEAAVLCGLPAPDDLAVTQGELLCSSGERVVAITQGQETDVAQFESRVACLATRPQGGFAVGLEDGKLFLWSEGEATEIARPAGLACPTALAFIDDDRLAVSDGGQGLRPSDWTRAIMAHNRHGSVWLLTLSGAPARRLAQGLAFPWGLMPVPGGDALLVSETGRHRLLRLPLDGGAPKPVLSGLPGYPARIAPAADGGAWLAIAAPRNRLVEFVLREDDYRQAMMDEIDPRFWIAPSLTARQSFMEPLQCGGVRVMGIHKPWAPTRSYGLVARLDPRWQPIGSAHSRANGNRHGVTGVAEHNGRLIAAVQGSNLVVTL